MTMKAEIDPETIPSAKPELGEFIEEGVKVTNNTLSPIVPMLGVVVSLINEIFTIYENAQFNKRMSRSIIDRILSVETTIKFLKSQTKYSENLQDLQHQESFVKFQATLTFETFFCATNIKKEFIELMKEYETCMNDLNFTMIIIFNEQRRIDNDTLTDTLAKMIKDTKAFLYQEICHINNKLEGTKDSIRQIDPTLLKEPSLSRRSDRRDQRFRRELFIMGKLNECQNIEKFYGLSEIDGKEVMILTINQPIDVVNWMSPEKMRKLFTESGTSNQIPYSKKCEIFSFGMLIWELAYQKIPYSNMKSNDVIIHVTKGNRKICDSLLDPENKVIHEGLFKYYST
ncbi:1342_t:CDS:2, partial [Gigaspora margarita]